MIAAVLAILGTLTSGALALWARLSVQRRIRVAREEGREELRIDACNHLQRQAEAKRMDGDKYTAAALESAAVYILHDLMDESTEALRNQTREKEREKELN